VSAVVIGATVFGEKLASSPGHLAFQLTGGVVAVAGIAVLSSSSIVRIETRQTPDAIEPEEVHGRGRT